MAYMTNRTYNEIKVGEKASLSHRFTHKDILLFAALSGDVNPAHVDEEYAKSDLFHKIVAHGMWGGTLLSTVLGTKLPGPGTIYLSQTLKFLHPITIGDIITATVTVVKKHIKKHIVELDCVCKNKSGKLVIVGKAKVIAPTEKIKRKRVILPKIQFKKSKPL